MDFKLKAGMTAATKQEIANAHRRNRQETTVQLRKAKKDERIKAKRLATGEAVSNPSMDARHPVTLQQQPSTINLNSSSNSNNNNDIQILQEAFQVFVAQQANPSMVPLTALLEAMQSARRLLCRSEHPPVDLFVEKGLIPYFVRFLQMTEHSDIVFEAEWALTNVTSASSKHVDVVLQSGAVDCLAKNLVHVVPSVRLQAAWCIGNIAGEGSQYRDWLLTIPAVVHGLIENLKNPDSDDLLLNVSWAVSGLCRGRPSFASIQPFIPHIANALKDLNMKSAGDKEKDKLYVDIIWALSYIGEGKEGIQALVELGVAPLLVGIVARMPRKGLLVPTIRAIGNLSVGGDEETDHILNAGYLEHASALLGHGSKNIQKDTCWTLSNITAGNIKQIQMVFDQERYCGLFHKLAKLAAQATHEIRKEAMWALCNVVEGGSDKQIRLLVEINKAVEVFIDALAPSTELSVLKLVLGTLKKLFARTTKRGDSTYMDLFAERGGLEPLEDLQSHPSDDVYKLSVELIETYFNDMDEEPDQNLAPEPMEDGFTFGVSKELFPASPMTFSFGVSADNR